METVVNQISGSGQGAVAILAVGLVLKLIGFAVRDEVLLRLLVAGGLTCDAIFYWARPEPILPSVLANVALVSINAVLLIAILTERTTWRMSDADRRVFAFFPTLTPGQFRRLRRIQVAETCAPGAVLTREGQAVNALMLVLADRVLIGKGGESFPVAGPVFVGEVAFLTGEASSADVSLPEGGEVLRMDANALRSRMARAPALSNAMVALFGTELARKVAYSLPMEAAVAKSPSGLER